LKLVVLTKKQAKWVGSISNLITQQSLSYVLFWIYIRINHRVEISHSKLKRAIECDCQISTEYY
ncbi:hypothetical protein, partial [Vibrio splendidus]|uniref:hypothetical protein n=1 Tax=Vibrio splendidus TaxID=29497 RepID=UPI001C6389CD